MPATKTLGDDARPESVTMDKLPNFVSEKLADLIEVRDQLRSWAGASMARADADRQRVGGLKQALQASAGTGMPAFGPTFGPAPEQVAAAQREIGELETRIDASVSEFSRRRAYADAADQVLNVCRDFLTRLPPETQLEPLPAVAISGNDLKKLLDLTRRDLADAQSKLTRLRQLPPPLSVVEQQLRDWVKAKANSQRLTIRTPRKQPLEITWHGAVPSPLGPTAGSAAPDPWALACRLDPGAVIAMLTEQSRHAPFANDGISDAAFDAEVGKLSTKISELAWVEETLVSKLQAEAPTSTQRRPDADPSIILGVRIVTRQRSARAA